VHQAEKRGQRGQVLDDQRADHCVD
jgi:hypothetical protein